MKDEYFYVGIEDPGVVRRSILESSKELIQALQRYERFKALRSEKYAQASRLKMLYDGIVALLSEVKADLPSMDIKGLPKSEERHFRAKRQADEASKKVPTGIEKLEEELNDIEKKLNAIQ
ncbi:hypothetical protein HYU11_00605 [Candidatus Woesearchaeota archaeon]|nr:hypothetical protein [Candidatus Woesearchaeota archaeon]